MTEREQEIQVSLQADKMLRQALDIKDKDNNKLIAEFMGTSIGYGNDYYTDDKFPYKTSWDWLMPVVKKIDNMFGDDNQVDDAINRVHNAVLSFDIDNTYQAVVEFINQNNNNNE